METVVEFVLDQLGSRGEVALSLAGLIGTAAPRVTQIIKRWLPHDRDVPPKVAHKLVGAVAMVAAWLAIGTGQWWAWAICGVAGCMVSEGGYKVGRRSAPVVRRFRR